MEEPAVVFLHDSANVRQFASKALGAHGYRVMRAATPQEALRQFDELAPDFIVISELEAGFFLGPNPSTLPAWKDDSKIWSSEDFENLDPVFDMELHPLFLFNQVIHILSVAKNNELIDLQKATKQICLGSDYDGLINAVDNCKQADKLNNFKELALEKMPKLLRKAKLDEGIDIPALVENIFYSNGRDFVINRLRSIGK